MSIFEANGAETCADCGRRGMAERDRLLAENAKLKDENEQLRDTMSQMAYDHAEQTREVRALKALIRDMYTCIGHVTETDAHWDCTACSLDGTRECDFEGRMITLGIEEY